VPAFLASEACGVHDVLVAIHRFLFFGFID